MASPVSGHEEEMLGVEGGMPLVCECEQSNKHLLNGTTARGARSGPKSACRTQRRVLELDTETHTCRKVGGAGRGGAGARQESEHQRMRQTE
jgi:hypothetical protein